MGKKSRQNRQSNKAGRHDQQSGNQEQTTGMDNNSMDMSSTPPKMPNKSSDSPTLQNGEVDSLTNGDVAKVNVEQIVNEIVDLAHEQIHSSNDDSNEDSFERINSDQVSNEGDVNAEMSNEVKSEPCDVKVKSETCEVKSEPEEEEIKSEPKEEEIKSETKEEEIKSEVKSDDHDESKEKEEVKAESDKVEEESSSSSMCSDMDQIYHVKWITFKGQPVSIVTQNSNGPCPLLAVVNVLLLKRKIALGEGCEVASSEQLLEYLGDSMLENVPENISNERRLDYEANVGDAVVVLPKLSTGIDVNVKFSGGVNHFEYTSECIIFDLFDIPLYHGWLVDPQQEDVVKAVDGLSYNQLVERIIANKNSQDSEKVSQSMVAQTFLEESASQLTYHGLCELGSAMSDDELGVFFRNNHFSTIYKHNNELFLLVTDQGFLKEPSVVWETLSSIDGDGHFVDGNFVTAPPKDSVQPPTTPSKAQTVFLPSSPIDPQKQIDQDLQLAMTLEAEQARQDWNSSLGVPGGLTDEELAKRLQASEEQEQQQRASGAAASASTSASASTRALPSNPGPSSSSQGRSAARSEGNSNPSQKTKNCVIL